MFTIKVIATLLLTLFSDIMTADDEAIRLLDRLFDVRYPERVAEVRRFISYRSSKGNGRLSTQIK